MDQIMAEFDVFLCHNSADKPEVIKIAEQLKAQGIRYWLDIEGLRPGTDWQEAIENQIAETASAAVFIGKSGLGPWQNREMRAFLHEFVDRDCPVIPTLLKSAPQKPKLPLFLKGLTWVDFRKNNPEPMWQLIFGITGKRELPLANSERLSNQNDQVIKQPGKGIELKKLEFTTAKVRVKLAFSGDQVIVDKYPGEAQYFVEDLGHDVGLDMLAIPGGSFVMGAPENEESSTDIERPQYQVNIQSFYMGRYPVTQAQWYVVAAMKKIERELEPKPAEFPGENRPVENVSWLDVQEFCKRLSRYTGKAYRLPSEAEWEYACRAGTNTPFYFGETIGTKVANYRGKNGELEDATHSGKYGNGIKGEFREKTTPVNSFPANAWGLHDMHGNVYEWCEDDLHHNYHENSGVPTDGSAWIEQYSRSQLPKMLRGGSWLSYPQDCRSAFRNVYYPDRRNYLVGFRIVCSAS
jgi:formylglycine-generating enzyme required for sulfatase activity